MNGFVKIHRSILDWEWWDDINTFRLFMTILLLANWKEKRWHGKVIPRGSLWTSIDSLARKSGLTQRQTRTALEKLISTNEVTSEATNEGRLITVVNYGLYQDVVAEATNEMTNETAGKRQASDKRQGKRATTTEEYIRSKKNKKGGREAPFSPTDFIHELMEDMEDDEEGGGGSDRPA